VLLPAVDQKRQKSTCMTQKAVQMKMRAPKPPSAYHDQVLQVACKNPGWKTK